MACFHFLSNRPLTLLQREVKDDLSALSVNYTKPSASYQLAVKLEKELRGVDSRGAGDADARTFADERASEKPLPARKQITHDADDEGKTPLHWFVCIEQACFSHASRMHRAAHKNWLTVARFLIEQKASVDAADKAGNRPMHEVRLLFELG